MSSGPVPGRGETPESTWFWDHYATAAGQAKEFIESVGIPIEGREVADIGSGDGILALGLHRSTAPRRLVGFDVNPVDLGVLRASCEREGVSPDLPGTLDFEVSATRSLPAEDASFDLVTTWSAFEHIADPYALLKEIRRIMRPDGCLFLQLWPFYHSERGSHLWEWFPDGFHHLKEHPSETIAALTGSAAKPPSWTAVMAREFEHLNRVTIDELQRCIIAAGLSVVKLELLTHPVLVPRELVRHSLSDLGIAGVKLLAVPS